MPQKIIRQYYLLSCLFSAGGLSLISAIYVTFLQKNGLNLFEVNLVNAVYFFTLFICEIPTGAFADIFGRKTSFIMACALMSASMVIYGCSHTFTGFIIAETIGAVGATFKSGAFRSWLVDNCKHFGFDGPFTNIFARETMFCQVAGCIGAIAGAYLSVMSPTYPWFFGGTMLAITTIIAIIVMKEPYFIHGNYSWKQGLISMKDITVKSIDYGRNHKAVRFILVITGIQIFGVQSLNMYWQPFFKAHGVIEAHFGYLFTGMLFSIATGALLVSLTKFRGKEKRMILITQIVVGVIVIITAIIPETFMIIGFFMLHEVIRGSWNPMIDGYLQERIPSKERATIASFCAIAPHIGGVIGLLASGAIAQLFGINTAWIVSGVVFIIGALFVAKNGYSEHS